MLNDVVAAKSVLEKLDSCFERLYMGPRLFTCRASILRIGTFSVKSSTGRTPR
jgi:hypothetical protein